MSNNHDNGNLNMLINAKSGIDSHGFQTIQVVGANSADEAANNISQYKLNYDPNPIVIRKTDPRGPIQYKQKVYVRYLRPPAAPEPGPLIIKEKRPPTVELPPLIVRQRAPRPNTPPPLILRELPPEEHLKGMPRYVDVTAERYGNHKRNRSMMPSSNEMLLGGVNDNEFNKLDYYSGHSKMHHDKMNNRMTTSSNHYLSQKPSSTVNEAWLREILGNERASSVDINKNSGRRPDTTYS